MLFGMGKLGIIAVTAALTMALISGAPPTLADDDPFTGCESVPIFGLSPSIRKICDGPIHPDGTWLRSRNFIHPTFIRSTCGGISYADGQCPPWNNQRDSVPASMGAWEFFYITVDTVPPGEPGHLDNPVRCTTNVWRCEIP